MVLTSQPKWSATSCIEIPDGTTILRPVVHEMPTAPVERQSKLLAESHIRQSMASVGYSLIGCLDLRPTRAVYAVYQSSTGQRATIKLLDASSDGAASAASRFRHEAQLHATLSHRNLAKLLGCGEINGLLYIALEWAPDTT